MNNVSIKKVWMMGMNHSHIDPPPIPIIKEKHGSKSDNGFVKLKFCRDPTSPTSDLYEFKMYFFDNVKPE